MPSDKVIYEGGEGANHQLSRGTAWQTDSWRSKGSAVGPAWEV